MSSDANSSAHESDLNGGRVVVTGAAGFIGSALVERLVESHGCEVVAIDNERSGDWSRLRVDCDRHHRSIEELTVDEWSDVVDGADAVFHLAAEKYNSSKSTPERVLDANVTAMNRLLRGVSVAGNAAKVVFTSSLYAYGSLGPDPMSEDDLLEPTTLYGASKAMGEYMLRTATRDTGLRWSVARLFFIYGPRQYAEGGYKSVIISNFERILAGERPTIYGDGRQSLDYVYIDDCVEALVALGGLLCDGLVANVATGEGVSVSDLTDMMLDVAGTDLEPVHADADWTAGSVRAGVADRIREETGWAASTSLPDGLRRVWDWMEANQ